MESETYASLESAYQVSMPSFRADFQSLEKSRSVDQVNEISDWLVRCTEHLQSATHRYARLPVALVQSKKRRSTELTSDLSVAVQRELSLIINRPVTVDCRGISDIGGLTRAIAVGILGEAVSTESSMVLLCLTVRPFQLIGLAKLR